MATGATKAQVIALKKLSYDARKKAMEENPGLKVFLNNKGVTDPNDHNLDKLVADRVAQQEEAKKPITPEGRFEKLVLGNEPIKSYQERYQGLAKGEDKGGAGWGAPLAVLGTSLNAGLDLIPGGKPAKQGGKAIFKAVVKETTQGGIRKLLTGKAPKEIVEKVSQALSKTTDANVTQRILLDNGIDLNKSNVRVIARGPTESKQLADGIKRGNLESTGSTVPIDSLRIGSDSADELVPKRVNKYVKDIENGKTLDPVVINAAGEVQDGKHRLMAMQQLGVQDVPVVRQIEKKVADPLVGEWADVLKSQEAGLRGGDLVPSFDGGKIRTTAHSPFYREFYKANGRIPSKADWYDEAERQIKAGKADPEFMKYYNTQNNPEFKSLAATQDQSVGKTVDSQLVDTSKGPNPVIQPRGERQFGTYKSAQRAVNVSDRSKRAISEIDPQTYKTRNTANLAAKADEDIAKGAEGAYKKLYTLGDEGAGSHEDRIALANKLLEHYSKVGDEDKVVKIAVDMAKDNLNLGRAIQANRVVERLSPAGANKYAEKILRANREKLGKAVKEGEVAGKLKKTVESAQGKSVEKVVDELSTGEKVAKRVANTVKPKVKKKADALVDELTKKIKEESLAPKVSERKSPTQLLREVFGRTDEAKEAYPEAQRLLREKFKDNPAALKTLEKFFSSELNLPAASSTIDNAIREQLAANKTKVAEIIKKSWNGQKTSVDEIAKSLVKEGFDEDSAKLLAKEATDRLSTSVKEAKTKVLERLAKDAPRKAKSEYADKIARLSNLGALDDADYIDLARGKLKLPHLTPKISKDISKLAQEMQDLPENSVERYLKAKEIGERINEDIPKGAGQVVREILGAPRAILASTDISGMGRQGFLLGNRFPKHFADSFAKQAEYLASPKNFEDGMAVIATDPAYKIINDKMKVALTGVSKRPEEVFESTILEGKIAKKLLAGHVIAASDRAYTGALTNFRFNVAKQIMEDLGPEKLAKLSDEEFESLGRYINTMTGRGGKPGGWLDKHGATLSQGLFSPRLWASRLEVLNPVYYAKLKGPARKLALQNAGAFAGVAGTALYLAHLAGAKVETDARSSDFLKIKFGDTRYDILGGLQQNLVFAHRFLKGEKKSSTTGEITKLGTDPFGPNRLSILSDLVQNKENPIVATATTLLKNKDRAGQPVNPLNEVGKLFVPLSVQELASNVKHYGPRGVASSIPGFFGVGTQTYGLKDINVSGKQKEYLENLKAKNAPPQQIEATKEFFQTIKTIPSTDNSMDKIKKALEANDLDTVRNVATEYNKQYKSAFKEWADKYGKQYSSDDLLKVYTNGFIDNEQINRAAQRIKRDAEDQANGRVRL